MHNRGFRVRVFCPRRSWMSRICLRADRRAVADVQSRDVMSFDSARPAHPDGFGHFVAGVAFILFR